MNLKLCFDHSQSNIGIKVFATSALLFLKLTACAGNETLNQANIDQEFLYLLSFCTNTDYHLAQAVNTAFNENIEDHCFSNQNIARLNFSSLSFLAETQPMDTLIEPKDNISLRNTCQASSASFNENNVIEDCCTPESREYENFLDKECLDDQINLMNEVISEIEMEDQKDGYNNAVNLTPDTYFLNKGSSTQLLPSNVEDLKGFVFTQNSNIFNLDFSHEYNNIDIGLRNDLKNFENTTRMEMLGTQMSHILSKENLLESIKNGLESNRKLIRDLNESVNRIVLKNGEDNDLITNYQHISNINPVKQVKNFKFIATELRVAYTNLETDILNSEAQLKQLNYDLKEEIVNFDKSIQAYNQTIQELKGRDYQPGIIQGLMIDIKLDQLQLNYMMEQYNHICTRAKLNKLKSSILNKAANNSSMADVQSQLNNISVLSTLYQQFEQNCNSSNYELSNKLDTLKIFKIIEKSCLFYRMRFSDRNRKSFEHSTKPNQVDVKSQFLKAFEAKAISINNEVFEKIYNLQRELHSHLPNVNVTVVNFFSFIHNIETLKDFTTSLMNDLTLGYTSISEKITDNDLFNHIRTRIDFYDSQAFSFANEQKKLFDKLIYGFTALKTKIDTLFDTFERLKELNFRCHDQVISHNKDYIYKLIAYATYLINKLDENKCLLNSIAEHIPNTD